VFAVDHLRLQLMDGRRSESGRRLVIALPIGCFAICPGKFDQSIIWHSRGKSEMTSVLIILTRFYGLLVTTA